MQTMSQAMQNGDDEVIEKIGSLMNRNVLCVEKPVPPNVYAALFRYIGVYYYVNGNEKDAGKWFRTALEIQPDFEWSMKELLPGDPLRAFFEQQRKISQIEPTSLGKFDFLLPEGKFLLLDGKPIKKPIATEERYHALLLIDKNSQRIEGRYLLNGNRFPEALIQKRRSGSGEDGDELFKVTKLKRVRPPSKTPLLVSGSSALLLAAGLYGSTFKTNADFRAAKTTSEMIQIKEMNNALVISSAVIGVVGLGLGYTGVLIDSDSPFLWNWR